jgi:hypothetical protein
MMQALRAARVVPVVRTSTDDHAANAVRCRQLCTEARDAGARSDATAHGHDGSADGGAHQH